MGESKRRGEVSGRQLEKAIKNLEAILDDPDAPAYAKQRAASDLIETAHRRGDTKAEAPDPDAPIVRQTLPWNSRPTFRDGRPELPRFGRYADDQRLVTIPPGFDLKNPQPEEHYAPFVSEWWRQYEIRVVERTAARLAIHRRHIDNGVDPADIENLLRPNRHDAIFRCVVDAPLLLPAPSEAA